MRFLSGMQVARGEIPYPQFMDSMGSGDFPDDVMVDTAEAVEEAVQAPSGPELPEKLVNTQAYLIWIESGRPMGADFGAEARERLTKRVEDGSSVSKLEVSGEARENYLALSLYHLFAT
jgi:hypothetical protein